MLAPTLLALLIMKAAFGFCDENYTTAELLDKADARLFRLVQRPEHCLHHLLPDTTNSCSMELRHRGHSFPLPQCKYNLSVQICVVVDGLMVVCNSSNAHAV